MDSGLFINERVTIPEWELEFSVSRGSGPGGQHANKTSSRVSLRWHLERSSVLTKAQKSRIRQYLGHRLDANGYLSMHADSERSQYKNKQEVRLRLVETLRRGLMIKKGRRDTRPTRASKERRLEGKKQKGQQKKLRRKPSSEDH